MERVGEKMAKNNVEDELVINTVTETFAAAAERAEKIKAGEYDFSLDEAECGDGEPEVPEELLESEEDKRLDEEEAEVLKKSDKVINISMAIGAGIAVILFVLFKFIL
jgi:hypothetical protein